MDDTITLVGNNELLTSVSLPELWEFRDHEPKWVTQVRSVRFDAWQNDDNLLCGSEGWDGESTSLVDWVEIGPAR